MWRAEISGEPFVLESLAKLPATPALIVEKDKGSVFLLATAFQTTTDEREVYKKAQELVGMLNTLLQVYAGLPGTLQVERIQRVNDDGSVESYVFGAASLASRGYVVASAQGGGRRSLSSVGRALEVAEQDPKVKEVLMLLGKEPIDWEDCYKVYEAIKKEVGGDEAIVAQGWVSSANELQLFRQTANALYRHPPGLFNPPRTPMSLSEAERLVAAMLRGWLGKKGV